MKPIAQNPFKAVRRAGVPICGIETADPAATIKACNKALNGKLDRAPLLTWDIVNGFRGLNTPGEEYVKRVEGPSNDPSGAFAFACRELPVEQSEGSDDKAGGVIYAMNAHRFIDEPATLQAVWNCRDVFKSAGVSLVLLGPAIKLPLELKNDIPVFPEPVPGEPEIGAVIDSLTADAGIAPEKIDRAKVIDGLLGYLSVFSVEQSLALSISPGGQGVDMAQLWQLKVQALKNCAGLEVTMPTTGFDSLVGCEGVKDVMRKHLAGKEPPRAIVQWEEVEKMLAAGQSDLSGTTQAMLEQFLFWTQERRVKGILLAGVPGAGKSLTCQAVAAEARCPLLRASMSTVKGSLVGQSEANMGNMLKAIDAVGQGRVLMLATCNSLEALAPEVMSRFQIAQFWYDFPTNEERAAIWDYYIKKFSLKGPAPTAKNWVGREIEACCEKAHLWNIPLAEAAKSVVPSVVGNATKLNAIRQNWSGRLLSAAQPGLFTVDTAPQQQTTASRRMEL